MSSTPDDCEETSQGRLSQYKARNNAVDQQERRRRLLEEQKAKRSQSFDASRGLIEKLADSDVDHDMEWEAQRTKRRHRNLCKDRLMFSEWLVHVPEDLGKLWYLVPCPVGRRTLVVATGGSTSSYSKNGYQMAAFRSALPGGSCEERVGCTILDCIWSTKNHSYYILDVIAWSNQSMMDCETEFRFYWLKSKLEEIPCLLNSSEHNTYAYHTLPYYQCETSTMANVMSKEHIFGGDGPALDGLLFYHSEAHYTPGNTPLVGWLKPHMMKDVLGIPVAPLYLQEEMESDKVYRKKHRKSRKNQDKSLETGANDDSNLEMESCIVEDMEHNISGSSAEGMEHQDTSLCKSEESGDS